MWQQCMAHKSLMTLVSPLVVAVPQPACPQICSSPSAAAYQSRLLYAFCLDQPTFVIGRNFVYPCCCGCVLCRKRRNTPPHRILLADLQSLMLRK